MLKFFHYFNLHQNKLLLLLLGHVHILDGDHLSRSLVSGQVDNTSSPNTEYVTLEQQDI